MSKNKKKNRAKSAIGFRASIRRAKEKGYVIENGQVQHRLVWKHHFETIPAGWVVHHINEIKTDNNIDNLVALPNELHNKLHKIQWDKNNRFTKADLMEVYESAYLTFKKINSKIRDAKNLIKQLEKDRELAGLDELLKIADTMSIQKKICDINTPKEKSTRDRFELTPELKEKYMKNLSEYKNESDRLNRRINLFLKYEEDLTSVPALRRRRKSVLDEYYRIKKLLDSEKYQ